MKRAAGCSRGAAALVVIRVLLVLVALCAIAPSAASFSPARRRTTAERGNGRGRLAVPTGAFAVPAAFVVGCGGEIRRDDGTGARFSVVATTTTTTRLFFAKGGGDRAGNDDGNDAEASEADVVSSLESILTRYGYGGRLTEVRCCNDDGDGDKKAALAEAYVDGELKFVRIRDFVAAKSSKQEGTAAVLTGEPPKVVVEEIVASGGNARRTIDIGQIVTVWQDVDDDDRGNSNANAANDNDLLLGSDQIERELVRMTTTTGGGNNRLADVVERAFDRLYRTKVGRGRSGGGGGGSGKKQQQVLTKKQVSEIVKDLPALSQSQRNRYESVLRSAVKAGGGLSRLVDSSTARSLLYPRTEPRPKSTNKNAPLQKAVAAKLLAADAASGGKFKRWPSVYVSHSCTSSSSSPPPENKQNKDGGGAETDVGTPETIIDSVLLLNGGWMVTDQGTRAGTEARKFVERSQARPDRNGNVSGDAAFATAPKATMADKRILRRLECLAMGELFSSRNATAGRETEGMTTGGRSLLENDVRDVLGRMALPSTPKGAKRALIRLGHWSGDEDFSRIQPWTKPIVRS